MKEQEVKVRVEDREKVVSKLRGLGYKIDDRIFQRTFRCWRPDKLFSRAGIFPRTRMEMHKNGRTEHTFTVKSRYKDPERGLFEREEREQVVTDAKKMAEALAIMGMSDQRILEKERIVFEREPQDSLEVLLDRFCFGSYLEVEGKPDEIDSLLKGLEIANENRLGMAYWDVYWYYCKEKGIAEKNDLILLEKWDRSIS